MRKHKMLWSALIIISLFLYWYLTKPPNFRTIEQSGGELVFVSGRYPDQIAVLYILNLDTGRATPLHGTQSADSASLSWSPDSQKIAFVGTLATGLSRKDDRYGATGIMLLSTQGEVSILGPCRYAPVWSPNGAWLAFHNACDQNRTTLNIAHVDGSGEREIVHSLTYNNRKDYPQYARISWSPDGQHLVYDDQNDTGEWRIWRIALDGTAPDMVTMGQSPAWSPIEDVVAFVRDGDIWLITDDTTEYKFLDDPVEARWPAWSPSGDQIAFVSLRDGNPEIYRVNLDGMGLENVTNNPSWDLFPVWRPE